MKHTPHLQVLPYFYFAAPSLRTLQKLHFEALQDFSETLSLIHISYFPQFQQPPITNININPKTSHSASKLQDNLKSTKQSKIRKPAKARNSPDLYHPKDVKQPNATLLESIGPRKERGWRRRNPRAKRGPVGERKKREKGNATQLNNLSGRRRTRRNRLQNCHHMWARDVIREVN